jgi:membrane-associated protein
VRTFAPFVAGIGRMSYARFLIYNVTGGILWVFSLTWCGYLFGNLPVVRENYSAVILIIIIISLTPMIYEYLRHKLAQS